MPTHVSLRRSLMWLTAALLPFLILASACSTRPPAVTLTPSRPATNLTAEAAPSPTAAETPAVGPAATTASAAPTPLPAATAVVSWQGEGEDGRCLQAQITLEALSGGPCDQEPVVVPLAPARQAELAAFMDTFDGFQAETASGTLAFNSSGRGGNQVPFPVQERMLAIWTRAVLEEATTGQWPAWDVALTWQPKTAGGCQLLELDLSGRATALACDGAGREVLASKQLAPEELATLYDWVDRLRPITTDTLTLAGAGSNQPDEVELTAIDLFARGLFAPLAAQGPGAQGQPAEPLVIARVIVFDSWSPDGRWLAYWSASEEDLTGQDPFAPPGGTLHFAAPRDDLDCVVAQFSTAGGAQARLEWLPDGTALVETAEGLFAGRPCQEGPFAPFEGQPVAQPEAPDPSLSPGGLYRATTTLLESQDGRDTLQTTLTSAEGGALLQQVTWQIDQRMGELGLGGRWASPSQFVLFETLERGPLLVDAEAGVIPVLRDIFGLDHVPSILGPEGYSWRAAVFPAQPGDGYHLAISGVGQESNFPLALLYHAENGLVETLPYQKIWTWGSLPDGWLLLFKEVTAGLLADGGINTGYQLWARLVDDVDGDWQLVSPAADNVLWPAGGSEVAYSQFESTLVWQSFPAADLVGRWQAPGYWLNPLAFSPDGAFLVVTGYQPGQPQNALFVLARP